MPVKAGPESAARQQSKTNEQACFQIGSKAHISKLSLAVTASEASQADECVRLDVWAYLWTVHGRQRMCGLPCTALSAPLVWSAPQPFRPRILVDVIKAAFSAVEVLFLASPETSSRSMLSRRTVAGTHK
ncbi:hypothetical protein M8818_000177 [Zalaria obscura]|uniref:Uncharacterized protein n=1 Tax=Zalaria obscura TaxID=2024903 RepID=A0ACC3SPE0_9PEZI